MSPEVARSEVRVSPPITMLEEPLVRVNDGITFRILAVTDHPDGGPRVPIGYTSTKAGHAEMLGEFSGEPTGRYRSCDSVKGWIDGNEVYGKNVYKDLPLHGFRTAIAQRRATKAVLSRLK